MTERPNPHLCFVCGEPLRDHRRDELEEHLFKVQKRALEQAEQLGDLRRWKDQVVKAFWRIDEP